MNNKQKYNLSLIIYFILTLFIFSNKIDSVEATSCSKNDKISNKECFNDVLIFNDIKWRAGHSAQNKNGLFILEFSNDGETGDRLFYGLKRNGRYYFDESPTKEIVLKGKDSIIARYESMNAFFALKDDINKNNEYFISISTYSCFMEMYDITTDNFKNDTIYNANFVGNQIFSFKFELLEYSYSDTVTYYMIFCHSTNNEGQGDKLSIKKIQFSDLSFNSDDIVKTITVMIEQLLDS